MVLVKNHLKRDRVILVWDLIAIGIMFIVNFVLNHKITRSSSNNTMNKPVDRKNIKPLTKGISKILIIPILAVFLVIALISPAHAYTYRLVNPFDNEIIPSFNSDKNIITSHSSASTYSADDAWNSLFSEYLLGKVPKFFVPLLAAASILAAVALLLFLSKKISELYYAERD